jgi:dienelactone hydrolase
MAGTDVKYTTRDNETFDGSRHRADIQVYQGAGHNFAMPRKQGYAAAAARESRERVLRCFKSM